MRFLIISGRSGSGKTSALHLLEDEGFTCIDNIPVTLLPTLITYISNQKTRRFALGIDARNLDGDLSKLASILENSSVPSEEYNVVYLDTQTEVLHKRFSETRRKHPLSNEQVGLSEALEKERDILAPIVAISDIIIDTSALNLHDLRSTVKRLVIGASDSNMAVMFTSFGFKHGMPTDADYVFDVRCLPNPHWEPNLRLHSGLEQPVIDYLSTQKPVTKMVEDIYQFINSWLSAFQNNNRSYLTIAIGCTGGMHRSVFISERLKERLKLNYSNVQVRHRDLKHGKAKA